MTGAASGRGPKYVVIIDDVEHEWDRPRITVPELRALGSIPDGTEVLLIDLRSNTERVLAESEVVELKPGMGFSKKIRFKRG